MRVIRHSLAFGVLVLAGCGGGGGDDRAELVYGVVRDELPSRLVLIRDDGTKAQRLTAATQGSVSSLPDWSPDGRRIAFVRYRAVPGSGGRGTDFEVYVVNADGTGERRLGKGNSPRWTSDGRFLVVERAGRGISSSEIYVMSPDRPGAARRLAVGSSPVPSHRGSRVAFVRYVYRLDASGECCVVVSSTLSTISLDGTGLRRLARITRRGVHFSQPGWRADDSAVSAVERTERTVGGRLVTFTRGGVRRVIVPNVGEAYDWSPQGDRLAYTYGGSSYVTRSDGTPVASYGLDAFDVRWSPDGREIALSVNDDPIAGGRVGIYVVEVGEGEPRRIAVEEGFTAYLDWRPATPQS